MYVECEIDGFKLRASTDYEPNEKSDDKELQRVTTRDGLLKTLEGIAKVYFEAKFNNNNTKSNKEQE